MNTDEKIQHISEELQGLVQDYISKNAPELKISFLLNLLFSPSDKAPSISIIAGENGLTKMEHYQVLLKMIDKLPPPACLALLEVLDDKSQEMKKILEMNKSKKKAH